MKTNYVSLSGGLGNQLFQFAGGLKMSKGKRLVLLTKLGKPSSSGELQAELFSYQLPANIEFDSRGKSNVFIKKVADLILRSSSSSKIHQKPVLKSLIQLSCGLIMSLYFRNPISTPIFGGTGFSRISEGRRSKLIIGFFHSYLYALPRESFINLSLREPDPRIAEYQRRSALDSPLVLHLRLGDYKRETKFGIPSVEYYRRSINFHLQTSHYKKIWVFTNEPAIAEEYLPDEFTHLYEYIPEIAESAAQTLEVMRLGHGFIIANSTYSWWGAYLSKHSKAVVTYPEPWFISAEVPSELIPPAWIGIDRE